MLEIEEVVPQYIMVDSEYDRTPNAFYAKCQDSVIIFNAFMERFYCYMDDNGRLMCAERVREDGNDE